MFHASILQIQEELHYHQQQQEKLEQELYTLKSYEEFAGQAFDNVKDTIEQIEDPKCLELFKESLLSLFPDEAPIYLEEKVEDTSTEVEDSSSIEETPTEKTYHELTGKPDLRPDTYEDLTPNITYSSSGRAYIGFDSREEAEKFQETLSEPSMIDEAVIMNNHKYELKFYCDRQYLDQLKQELEDDWTPEQKAELDWQEQLVRIANDIFYDPSQSKCYLGFSNRGRANTYGAHLKEIHDLYDSRYTVDKSKVVTNCKHELVIESITKENAEKLAKLNLKKDLEYKTNQVVTDSWGKLPEEKVITKDVNIYIPQEEEKVTLKKSKGGRSSLTSDDGLSENDFPSYPYSEIPLDQIEFGDVITSTPYSRSAYMVKEHKGEFVMAECLYHKSLPGRVGEEFSFTTPYLVEKATSVAA